MSYSTKGKLHPFDSKNHNPDKGFNQIFKLLNTSITSLKMDQDEKQAQNLSNEAFETLDATFELIKERQENLKIEDQNFKNIVAEINAELESQVVNILEESVQTAAENFETWKLLVDKKETFEKMHQNLLMMKKSILPVKFFKRPT